MKEKRNISPPQLFLRFFRWFCHPRLQKPIEGDLMELYDERVKELGKRRADRKFKLDVLQLFRPNIIKPADGTYRLTNYGMLKNYFKVSTRSILRNKTFSFLNVTGLSVGIASCILILIYVQNEMSYDTYNSQYDNTYRVIHHFGYGRDVKEDVTNIPNDEYQVWGNAPVGRFLKTDFPEVKTVFQFTSPNPWLVEYEGKAFQEDNIIFADSTAFDVFDWDLISGNPKTALVRPHTIVLTTQLAQKIFGKESALGKTVRMDNEDLYEVTGVVEVPGNSHFTFDGMISMSTFRKYRPQIFDSWGYVDFYTYFTLHPGATIDRVKEATPAVMKSYKLFESGYFISYEPLADAYLQSTAGRQPGSTGSLANIYTFLSVAAFILLIACINFMNLSTARSVERAKEVAIRKTIGSHRTALISQFLVESILLTLLAAVLASVLILFGYPYLEFLSGKSLPISWLFSYQNILLALLMVITIGLSAGSYPAFVLSKFKPVKVLKGSFKASTQGIWLRKSLVILQFSLSVILLVGSAVVYSQLRHLRQYDLGFNPDQVLVVDYGWDQDVQRNLTYLKAEMSKQKDVISVSASRATPGDFFPNAGTKVTGPSGALISESPAIYEIDEGFVPTYEMEIVAGRNFSKDFPLDSSNSLILNESAARLYGYPNPQDIIGKNFEQWERVGKVIGVLRDFNYVSLHKKVEPLSLRYSTSSTTSMLSIRLQSSDYEGTLQELENIWSRVVPHRPFVSHFTNDNFNMQYKADERFGIIFAIFSGLAMFVACLGLFGLTIYSTSQRIKEIGVRKVLGASTKSIVSLLSTDFIKLFVLSLLLSVPVSWYVMDSWLNGFAYRISLGFEVFAVAAIITLLVALITMSFKTVKAALSNPIESLRDE